MEWYWLLVGYLFGSTPTGFLAVKLQLGEDIRNYGSGNIGATNVGRVLGRQWAIITALVDMFKGGVAVGLARLAGVNDPLILALVGMAGVLGHNFPVWLRFKGGKGVATSFGVLFFFHPAAAILGGIVWYVTMKVTRYVSVASMFALTTAPVWLIVVAAPLPYVWVAVFFGGLTVVRHRVNVTRLLDGTENRVGTVKSVVQPVEDPVETQTAVFETPVPVVETVPVPPVVPPEPAEPDEMDDFLPDWSELPDVTEYEEVQEAPKEKTEEKTEEKTVSENASTEDTAAAKAGSDNSVVDEAKAEKSPAEPSSEDKADKPAKKPAPRRRTRRKTTKKPAGDEAAPSSEGKGASAEAGESESAAEEKKSEAGKRRKRRTAKPGEERSAPGEEEKA